MTLLSFRPFGTNGDIFDTMNKTADTLERYAREVLANTPTAVQLGSKEFSRANYPKIEIRETATDLVIEAHVPGYEKSDVKLILEKDNLYIKGDKKQQVTKDSGEIVYTELKKSAFSRLVATLTEKDFKVEAMHASLTNGILLITVPKQRKQVDPPKEDKKEVIIN